MTFVIANACIDVMDQSCIEVCPVDCILVEQGDRMCYIEPNDCIDCGVCEPECPAEAILPDSDSGADKWLDLNATQSNIWPNITEKKDQLSDAEDYQGMENKFEKFYSVKQGK